MNDVLRVLREAESQVEAVTWQMWCGARCAVFSDGALVPALDFYLERWCKLATCRKCLDSLKRSRARGFAAAAT